MSSILDALKKLEEEKAAKRAKEGGGRPPVESMTPLPDMHRAPHPVSNAASMNPRTLLLGIGAMSIALVAISVTVSVFLLRPSAPAVVAQAPRAAQPVAAPAPAPVEVVPAPIETAPAVPAPEEVVAVPAPEVAAPKPAAPLAPQAAPETAEPVAAAPSPAPKPEPAPAPAPKPEAVAVAAPAPEPEPEPMPEPTPLPTVAELTRAPEPEPQSEPEPAPAPESLRPKDVAPVEDLKALPELRSTDRMRHGLEAMRINFLRESAPQRPAAMAVINLNKIHIGEVIPGTTARLVAVERHGIGIEITSTGDRFYVPL